MKYWSGRFTKETEGIVDRFGASIPFDCRLAEYDIQGSIAYAHALEEAGVLSGEERARIEAGLSSILDDVKGGKIAFKLELEDIHTNIEKLLEERVGDIARKLHTGRSRNDQVALDMRLYVREQARKIVESARELQRALVKRAEEEIDVVMPAYTHLQRAQPVLFSHHLMAYFEMLERDVGRFRDCLRRMDEMPLGSGAACGTAYPISREALAKRLGFARITANSLDAVSDRDFVIEFLAACALLMMHLSRLCEEIVLWSSQEFGFIELDDAHATGSSMMPQKKNPDVAELIRGKSGRVYGDLVSLLVTMKGLPLAYNKDMQEDKEALFDAADTVLACLEVLTPVILALTVRKGRMESAVKEGFLVATDIADYLVRKGMAFRDAHRVAGRVVLHCIENGRSLCDLSVSEWKGFSDLFQDDILQAITVESSLNARSVPGGTSRAQVLSAIANAKKVLYIKEDGIL
ncbi:MAG TPA: argininosuccinate lyase [Firmicutes bacterium]|nr:argininosuccinate lyase [Bacillota bacterium]